ncbi:hypothetical protein NUW58_g10093 [Xylaria curta]|uniref:Uncharacterized protein n=1 Tax=Xylaria curta TaxID=42375 RepID=A0ACC1MQQ5_9PEZI|nr:hypothetical protein NUW58_g10093 [Xylaria curta]
MTNTLTTDIQACQRICGQGRNGGEGRDESSDRNFRGQDSDPRQLENGTRNDDMTTVQAGSLLTPLSARKVCYYLIAGLVLGVAVSFAIALWWAQSHGDISAAFTIGSYFVAVDALFLAVFTAIHVPKCQCWDILDLTSTHHIASFQTAHIRRAQNPLAWDLGPKLDEDT